MTTSPLSHKCVLNCALFVSKCVFPNVCVVICIRFDLVVFLDVFEVIFIWFELLENSIVVVVTSSPTNFASN